MKTLKADISARMDFTDLAEVFVLRNLRFLKSVFSYMPIGEVFNDIGKSIK
jgi:hypothetical protein